MMQALKIPERFWIYLRAANRRRLFVGIYLTREIVFGLTP
jgi:hypothetical protein